MDVKDMITVRKNKGFKYISVVFDNFSKIGLTALIENKDVQTKKLLFKTSFIQQKITEFY